ncbi:MAG: ribbon-helix-helix protein, CopG family [Deltaproteobacteria bacterium]|nr:ribbon-helix-helix protein, CopG family [Deltaproteobacteria bacterium]
MERQNLTLSLPRALLKKAKILAARREVSLSELIREAIEERVHEDTGYQKARRRHTHTLLESFDLGTNGHLEVSREDLHERD